jgi:hypothetical protein
MKNEGGPMVRADLWSVGIIILPLPGEFKDYSRK